MHVLAHDPEKPWPRICISPVGLNPCAAANSRAVPEKAKYPSFISTISHASVSGYIPFVILSGQLQNR